MIKTRAGLLLSVSVAAWAAIPFATAQEATDTGGSEEVTVTAQKTKQSLQKVPLAVSAIGAKAIEDSRIRTAADLQEQTPGLRITSLQGGTQIAIRGVGFQFPNVSGEPGVAFNVDGVYIGRPTATGAIMNDLLRIEVLRGPQGTLYGRNAVGGVVNLITRVPGSEGAFDGSVSYGSHNNIEAFAGVEGALGEGESVRGRLSAYANYHDGYKRNLFLGRDGADLEAYAFRGVLVTDLSSDVSIEWRADYSYDYTDGLFNTVVGEVPNALTSPWVPGGPLQGVLNITPTVPIPPGGRDVVNDTPSFSEKEAYGASATLVWSPAGTDLTVKSITAWRDSEFSRRVDVDGSSAAIFEETLDVATGEQFSQELNVSGRLFGDARFIAGLYYFQEDATDNDSFHYPALADILSVSNGFPPGTIPDNIDYRYAQDSTTYAIFGQVTVPVSDKVNLTGGLRYTNDEKVVVQSIDFLGTPSCTDLRTSRDWDSVTWKAGVDYSPTDDTMLYAGITTGFKAGGIALGACANAYDPEELTAYEIGIKTFFANRRVRLNVSAFYYDYENLQANIYTVGGATVVNADGATQYGTEIEFAAQIVEGLEASVNLSLLDSELGEFHTTDPNEPGLGVINLKGNKLEKAPDWTAGAALSYVRSVGRGEMNVRWEVFHSDSYFNDSFNSSYAESPAYTVHNVKVSWSDDKWEFGAYGKNIFDEEYTTMRLPVQGIAVTGQYAPGAWFGVYAKVAY
ncbi:MAG: TonB-dependent receptor [Micropepsaceae bacterium]